MKISYMLWNKTGKGRIKSKSTCVNVFSRLKKTIRECRLALVNLHIEQRDCSDELLEQATFSYKGPILYVEGIAAKRITHVHEDTFEDQNTEMA